MAASFFLQANEWRGGESIMLRDHTRREETKEFIDHEAPRGQPQKRSGEAPFLARAAADLVAHEFACKLLPEKQSIPFFLSLSRLILRKIGIVRNYNRDSISFYH